MALADFLAAATIMTEFIISNHEGRKISIKERVTGELLNDDFYPDSIKEKREVLKALITR